jgi:hypothetical protein
MSPKTFQRRPFLHLRLPFLELVAAPDVGLRRLRICGDLLESSNDCGAMRTEP